MNGRTDSRKYKFIEYLSVLNKDEDAKFKHDIHTYIMAKQLHIFMVNFLMTQQGCTASQDSNIQNSINEKALVSLK